MLKREKKNTRVQHHILFKDLYINGGFIYAKKRASLFKRLKIKCEFFFTSNSLTKLETQKNYFNM